MLLCSQNIIRGSESLVGMNEPTSGGGVTRNPGCSQGGSHLWDVAPQCHLAERLLRELDARFS